MPSERSGLRSADAAYVLAFSVIMLNTDLHNTQVRDQFMGKRKRRKKRKTYYFLFFLLIFVLFYLFFYYAPSHGTQGALWVGGAVLDEVVLRGTSS